MSRKKIFNGKRLKAARTYRGKTIDVLAKEANINKKDILAFEEDKYKPVVENELKISNTLNFPREYF
jgi:DNA-binding XRE family transcriptional regulator